MGCRQQQEQQRLLQKNKVEDEWTTLRTIREAGSKAAAVFARANLSRRHFQVHTCGNSSSGQDKGHVVVHHKKSSCSSNSRVVVDAKGNTEEATGTKNKHMRIKGNPRANRLRAATPKPCLLLLAEELSVMLLLPLLLVVQVFVAAA